MASVAWSDGFESESLDRAGASTVGSWSICIGSLSDAVLMQFSFWCAVTQVAPSLRHAPGLRDRPIGEHFRSDRQSRQRGNGFAFKQLDVAGVFAMLVSCGLHGDCSRFQYSTIICTQFQKIASAT
jgi:hypothetical protein